MARYGKEHKQATRRRIIETAGRRFKRDGIDGSGDRHADGRRRADQRRLLRPLRIQGRPRRHRGRRPATRTARAASAPWPRAAPGVEQYVREYLSIQHRDNPGDGCPSAALLDEIGRCTDAAKQAYTDGLLAIIDDIAARLAPDNPQSARVQTLSVFAMMIGTLQLSRALADRQLADAVLDAGHPERPRAPGRQATNLTLPISWSR